MIRDNGEGANLTCCVSMPRISFLYWVQNDKGLEWGLKPGIRWGEEYVSLPGARPPALQLFFLSRLQRVRMSKQSVRPMKWCADSAFPSSIISGFSSIGGVSEDRLNVGHLLLRDPVQIQTVRLCGPEWIRVLSLQLSLSYFICEEMLPKRIYLIPQ